MSEREKYFYLAQLLEQTDRYEDTANYMKRVIELSPELTSEERQFLSVVYKNLVQSSRTALRNLSVIINNEHALGRTKFNTQLSQFQSEIASELENNCTELINLIENQLFPHTKDIESKIFYLKLKGDYLRYVCEVKQESQLIERAETAYLSAIEITKNESKEADPVSLGVYLNYSVFLFEIKKESQKAIDIGEKILEEAALKIDEGNPSKFQEAISTLQLLRENITFWKEGTQ